MPGSVPQDIMDAVLQALRLSNCAVLFGDTWNASQQIGIQKFFADWSDQTGYPQAVVNEPGETYQFMTAAGGNEIPYLADGTLTITVYASDRYEARQLGKSIGRALNDARLSWIGERLLMLRMRGASFIPNPPTGPGIPTVFVRQVVFDYEIQGVL